MAREVDLEPRLAMIADMIPKCDTLCDVGTDHAYIPIYAAQKRLCRKIIATDIREGPIQMADRNIVAYDVQDLIETRVGDGLDCIGDLETDIVLICGMGGLTITEMLEKQKEKVVKCNQLIIQCMYADEMLREYCYISGLDIIEERICSDRNKLYTAMRIIPGGQAIKLHPVYHYISQALLKQDHPLVLKYLDRWIVRLTRIRAGYEKAKEYDSIKIEELNDIIEQLKEIKNKLMKGRLTPYDDMRPNM